MFSNCEKPLKLLIPLYDGNIRIRTPGKLGKTLCCDNSLFEFLFKKYNGYGKNSKDTTMGNPQLR